MSDWANMSEIAAGFASRDTECTRKSRELVRSKTSCPLGDGCTYRTGRALSRYMFFFASGLCAHPDWPG